jgi:uncharacterized membrane protein YhaH (DUF805 family)
MDIYLKSIFYKYADFKGRSTFVEYWTFFLYNVVIMIIVAITAGLYRAPVLVPAYQVVIFLPWVSAGVRRLHDTGRSGWWLILPLYNFYLLTTPSGQNKSYF